MPLDPQIAALLEQLNQAPPMSLGTPEQARASFRQMTVAAAAFGPEIEVGEIIDREVPGAAGPLPARLYKPTQDPPEGTGREAEDPLGVDYPTLVFFHGGGFVIGDIASYDAQCRTLCRDGRTAVLSVEYRVAPEDPFPAAAEDAIAAAAWALDNAGDLGGDPDRVAVGGDSAGGNLAAVAAQALRGHEPALAGQLLLYPVTDFSEERPSVAENGEGLFLTGDDMRWFREKYIADASRTDPRASPLHAEDLSGLPPALVVTAEFDPLRDDGEAYAVALEAAGVPVVKLRFDGLIHGFFAMGTVSTAAASAIEEIGAELRKLLDGANTRA
jgi:acetyl esterase